jgi:CO/xanthine dehydrogenase Mo-binding subunit
MAASRCGLRRREAHDLYQNLCAFLRIDETRLRVATPDVGGGFGPKLCVYPEDVAVPAAAKLLKRSLKWIEDRREHFMAAVQERDQYWNLEIAVDAEARILGVRGKLFHDQGAYALQDVNLPYNSASALPGRIMCRRSPWMSWSHTPTRRPCRPSEARAIRKRHSPSSGCWTASRAS